MKHVCRNLSDDDNNTVDDDGNESDNGGYDKYNYTIAMIRTIKIKMKILKIQLLN